MKSKSQSAYLFKKSILNILYYSGLFTITLKLLKLFIKSPIGIILTYHHIRKNNSTDELMSDLERGITDQIFQDQMKFISRKFKINTLANIIVQGIDSFSKNKIVMAVTFDDAYQSVFELAIPILYKYNTPATIFVPASYIGTKHPFWWFVVSDVMKSISQAELNKLAERIREVVSDQELYDYMKTAVLDSNRERVLSRRKIAIRIGILKENDRQLVIGCFKEISSIELSDDRKVINSQQLKELHDLGFELASHTLTHPDLTTIKAERVHDEIKKSKLELEKALDSNIDGFAYPYGKVDNKVAGIVAEAGYTYAVTTMSGAFDKDTDPFMLPRISIGLDPSMPEFYFHIIRVIYRFIF